MISKKNNRRYAAAAGLAAAASVIILFAYRIPLWEHLTGAYAVFSDPEKSRFFVSRFGSGGPVIFILIQVCQVILAPIPGEATGFIGGYLFGTFPGFVYSTIGLTLGSWLNFIIGRFLGRHYVRRIIPSRHLDRFDAIVRHQGIFVLFILFVFPGFPKDYLCLFLGLSTLPMQVFLPLVTIGRMPGTFLLSLQGESLMAQRYGAFLLICGICLILGFIAYRYRKQLYAWIERG